MRAAVIQNGVVVNVIKVASLGAMPGLVAAGDASIGDRYENGAFVKPVRALTMAEHNAPILAALDMIDAKSIRPLREGDAARVADLEAQAAALRLQLRKV